MTEAFLFSAAPIDSATQEDEFRTTDGKRWYGLDWEDEEDLDDDAPPWAKIAQWRRRLGREGD
jgi:hypothetical protein